jgi:hypothetical protein
MDISDAAFNAALARFVQNRERLGFVPEVVSTAWQDGQDIQIGDYTWDHENAEFLVRYRDPAGHPSGIHTLSIDLESHGFGQLIQDIVRFWQ